MQKTGLFRTVVSLLLLSAGLTVVPLSQADGVIRKRVVSNDGLNTYQRSAVRSDGQGNAYRRQTAAVETRAGGSGYQVTQTKRHADGSASKSVSKSVNGAGGASFDSQKQIARDAEGNLTASRSISGETRNGKQYDTQVSVADGQVTRTHSCTDSSGNAVACR